uniref:Uncharacterized protein n=1 Tax=viral metagenome TaxID=1070528 RepID=A0A6C0BLZ6_9ZZZZ
MYFLLVIALCIIIIFLLWAEDRSQNGLEKPCQHSHPNFSDRCDLKTRISRLIANVNLSHSIVEWRRSLLVAIICTLLISLILVGTMDAGTLIFTITVVFLIIYVCSGIVYWSIYQPRNEDITRKLLKIQTYNARYNRSRRITPQ